MFPTQLEDLEELIKKYQITIDKQRILLDEIKLQITRTQTLLKQIRKMYDDKKD